MRRVLKTYTDDRLGRKVAVLRGASLLMLASLAVVIVLAGSEGRFEVSTSRSGSRFASPSIRHTIIWSDSPFVYLFQLAWHFLIGAALIAAIYIVLARIIEHFHGRSLPFFRRKYPH